MRIAFYAPLKSPDHAVPSGDRQLARNLVQALRLRGHEVTLASRFRSFDRTGEAARQLRLAQLGTRVADRLLARYRAAIPAPQLWFTYHLWHKAPDLLGPRISRALDIPYVVAEASIAPKQRHGRWATGYEHARQAIDIADAVIALNPVDVEQLTLMRGQPVELLPAFIDITAFAGAASARKASPAPVRLVTVAMMREGAKLASYRVLAKALTSLVDLRWELVVVGDGPARRDVELAFATMPPGRVRFAGLRAATEIAALLKTSDVFVWPAVDEAFGLVFLEAQACGLPVVAGDAGGVAGVVAAGRSGFLVREGDADAFAAATRRLVLDAELRARMGREARDHVRERHDLPTAADRLDRFLQRVLDCHAARAAPSRC